MLHLCQSNAIPYFIAIAMRLQLVDYYRYHFAQQPSVVIDGEQVLSITTFKNF